MHDMIYLRNFEFNLPDDSDEGWVLSKEDFSPDQKETIN